MIADLFASTGIALGSAHAASQNPRSRHNFSSRAVLQLRLDNLPFPLPFATVVTIRVACL